MTRSRSAHEAICRACGGEGIDAGASRVAAETARVIVLMVKDRPAPAFPPGTSPRPLPWRCNVTSEIEDGSTWYKGPLWRVVEVVHERLADGYQIVQGDMPDIDVRCERCGGWGRV